MTKLFIFIVSGLLITFSQINGETKSQPTAKNLTYTASKKNTPAPEASRLITHSHPVIETSDISIVTIRNVECHVAAYENKTIITLLSGPEKNKQLIFVNKILADVSQKEIRDGDSFTHNYSWGKVITEPRRQSIALKDKGQ